MQFCFKRSKERHKKCDLVFRWKRTLNTKNPLDSKGLCDHGNHIREAEGLHTKMYGFEGIMMTVPSLSQATTLPGARSSQCEEGVKNIRYQICSVSGVENLEDSTCGSSGFRANKKLWPMKASRMFVSRRRILRKRSVVPWHHCTPWREASPSGPACRCTARPRVCCWCRRFRGHQWPAGFEPPVLSKAPPKTLTSVTKSSQ